MANECSCTNGVGRRVLKLPMRIIKWTPHVISSCSLAAPMLPAYTQNASTPNPKPFPKPLNPLTQTLLQILHPRRHGIRLQPKYCRGGWFSKMACQMVPPKPQLHEPLYNFHTPFLVKPFINHIRFLPVHQKSKPYTAKPKP